jgi:hypothetical protein
MGIAVTETMTSTESVANKIVIDLIVEEQLEDRQLPDHWFIYTKG